MSGQVTDGQRGSGQPSLHEEVARCGIGTGVPWETCGAPAAGIDLGDRTSSGMCVKHVEMVRRHLQGTNLVESGQERRRRQNRESRRRVAARKVLQEADHGTARGVDVFGCGCEECRAYARMRDYLRA